VSVHCLRQTSFVVSRKLCPQYEVDISNYSFLRSNLFTIIPGLARHPILWALHVLHLRLVTYHVAWTVQTWPPRKTLLLSGCETERGCEGEEVGIVETAVQNAVSLFLHSIKCLLLLYTISSASILLSFLFHYKMDEPISPLLTSFVSKIYLPLSNLFQVQYPGEAA